VILEPLQLGTSIAALVQTGGQYPACSRYDVQGELDSLRQQVALLKEAVHNIAEKLMCACVNDYDGCGAQREVLKDGSGPALSPNIFVRLRWMMSGQEPLLEENQFQRQACLEIMRHIREDLDIVTQVLGHDVGMLHTSRCTPTDRRTLANAVERGMRWKWVTPLSQGTNEIGVKLTQKCKETPAWEKFGRW